MEGGRTRNDTGPTEILCQHVNKKLFVIYNKHAEIDIAENVEKVKDKLLFLIP